MSSFSRKFRKLVRSPFGFLADSPLGRAFGSTEVSDHAVPGDARPLALMMGFAPWKRDYIEKCFPEYRMVFVKRNMTLNKLDRQIRSAKSTVIIAWGYQEAEGVDAFAAERELSIYRMEDGFVRSSKLGAAHTLPRSLALDKSPHLYFDAGGPSDLETILATHDFADDEELVGRARYCLDQLRRLRLSKYNNVGLQDAESLFAAHAPRQAGRNRILVIGQVEDDASLQRGRGRGWSNLDLVKAAAEENPDADVFFKPHPDFLGGHTKNRENKSTLEEIEEQCFVLRAPLALADSFDCIDHVYTLTSLSGFEALLRGLKVTVFGMPFYAGWGLTDDRQVEERRNRKLSVEELFAGAYLLYPRYFRPPDAEPTTLEITIEELAPEISAAAQAASA